MFRLKDRAFSEALNELAKQNGTQQQADKYIKAALVGYYATRLARPAFIYDNFGITDAEWDAIIALIYG